jgi:hypothetical protein
LLVFPLISSNKEVRVPAAAMGCEAAPAAGAREERPSPARRYQCQPLLLPPLELLQGMLQLLAFMQR